MDNKKQFIKFIRNIKNHKLLTSFLSDIFDYNNLTDNNYIFRIQDIDDRVVIDIFDNISQNRFNRYIFIFGKTNIIYHTDNMDGVYVTYIGINNVHNNDNKLIKLGFLFKLDKGRLEYAKEFLSDEIVSILKKTS